MKKSQFRQLVKEVLSEKHLTPAQKREEEKIVKGLKKSNPKMPGGKMYAIATAKAKEVAECGMPKPNSSMIKGELRDLIMNASLLYNAIQPGKDLPAWILDHIAVATDHVHSVKEHVMEWQAEHPEVEQELYEADSKQYMDVEVQKYVHDKMLNIEVEPLFKAYFEFEGENDIDLVSEIEWNSDDFTDKENNAIRKWVDNPKNTSELLEDFKEVFFEKYKNSPKA